MEQLLQMDCFSSATSLDHRPDLPPLKVSLSVVDPMRLPLTTRVVKRDEQRDDLQSLAGITCHSLSYSLGSNCAVVEQNPSGCNPATAFGRQVSYVQIVSPRPDYADHARQINNAWHNPLPKITLINAIYSKASPARLP